MGFHMPPTKPSTPLFRTRKVAFISFLLLTALEGIGIALWLILFAGESENAILFGLSIERLLLAVICAGTAVIALGVIVWQRRKEWRILQDESHFLQTLQKELQL